MSKAYLLSKFITLFFSSSKILLVNKFQKWVERKGLTSASARGMSGQSKVSEIRRAGN